MKRDWIAYAEGVYAGLAEVSNAGYSDWPGNASFGFIWVASFAESQDQFLKKAGAELWSIGLRVLAFSDVSCLRVEDILAPKTDIERLAATADKTRRVEFATVQGRPEVDPG